MAKKKRKISKSSLQSQVLNILRQNVRKAFNYKQLAKRIGIGDDNTKLLLQSVLIEMENKEHIVSVAKVDAIKSQSTIVEGVLDINNSGNVLCYNQ